MRSRVDRVVNHLKITETALNSGWHTTNHNMPRTITYYKGPSWVRVGFSRITYEINHIQWWDNSTSRMHLWERKDSHSSLDLITSILQGKLKSGLVL